MTGQEEAHEAQRENAELKARVAELEALLAPKPTDEALPKEQPEDKPAVLVTSIDAYLQTR